MGSITDIDDSAFFWELQGRYRSFALRRLKTYLDNAGYRGTAFIYMLVTKKQLLEIYRQTPLFREIIQSFEGAFVFDRRAAVAEALKTAQGLGRQEEQTEDYKVVVDFTAQPMSEEAYRFWRKTLLELGRGKVGYVPEPQDFPVGTGRQQGFVVKLLTRYHTLKELTDSFDRAFPRELVDRERENGHGDKNERFNQAIERIGRSALPELFASPDAEPHEGEPESFGANLERMEWLGSQKELAELFIELERKGWVKKKIAATIQGAFTESNTIAQVLKPGNDREEATFPGVYTARYRPRFDAIRENRKK